MAFTKESEESQDGGRRRGRGRRVRKSRRGRGNKGGSFLVDMGVPLAFLAATQYAKSRKGYRGTKRNRSRRNFRRRSMRR